MTVNDDRLDTYAKISDWWQRWKERAESLGPRHLVLVESTDYADRVTVYVTQDGGRKKWTKMTSDEFQGACQCDVGIESGEGLIAWILEPPQEDGWAEPHPFLSDG